jgi:DNA helicase II / ATP-dependent DNA helicase PcrA
MGVAILRQLRDRKVKDADAFTAFWVPKLDVRDVKDRQDAINIRSVHFYASFTEQAHSSVADWSSSIHRAKGLEATAVLVVAKTRNELMKWLVKGKAARGTDKADTCRLGFVAFSRARELLCIAALESLDDASLAELQYLGVHLC